MNKHELLETTAMLKMNQWQRLETDHKAKGDADDRKYNYQSLSGPQQRKLKSTMISFLTLSPTLRSRHTKQLLPGDTVKPHSAMVNYFLLGCSERMKCSLGAEVPITLCEGCTLMRNKGYGVHPPKIPMAYLCIPSSFISSPSHC